MTPAVKLALAYCSVMGRLPSYQHGATRSAAYRLIDFVPYWDKTLGMELHRYVIKPEGLAAIESHPLKIAADWFKARGFRLAHRERGGQTSHCIAFAKRDCEHWHIEGLAYRSGGGSVTIRHNEKPFVTSLQIAEAETVWPAILRPSHYVGKKPAYETGRDYLARAMTAYRESL